MAVGELPWGGVALRGTAPPASSSGPKARPDRRSRADSGDDAGDDFSGSQTPASHVYPFATLKMRMGATHFLMKRLPKVATEMAPHVLAYNLTRVMNIIGVQPLVAMMRA
jgi:hypothetical protein